MPDHAESVERVTLYYDALGEGEWTRLTDTVRGRVSREGVGGRANTRFVASCCHTPRVTAMFAS